MATRRIGADWFAVDVEFDEFETAPSAFYSIDGAPDVLIGVIGEGDLGTIDTYEETYHGTTVTIYRGTFNGAIPAEAFGSNVVVKIYDPDNANDILEYDAIDVCTDDAVEVAISPASTVVRPEGTREFTALFVAADGLPTDSHDTAVWTVEVGAGGTIDEDTGIFTAGTEEGGPWTITVTAGLLTDTAQISIKVSTARSRPSVSTGIHL
jgi:hypothetical protein